MIRSVNPYTLEQEFEIREFEPADVAAAIDTAHEQYQSWKNTSFGERAGLMRAAAAELRGNSREYASTITKEMGKPITQALEEIEKCAKVCDFYAAHAQSQLAEKHIDTDAYSSYVRYEPIGVVLAVMPWNYPFWQVFRFAAPALMAGNVAVLKHASNVMMSAENIEKVFTRAGFTKGCFTNLPIRSALVEDIIRNPHIKAVTLTGSENAGKAVAAIAGSEVKKTVLELGGSNALVVFEDCNMEQAVKTCIQSRFQNAGQSCIAGKRLLVQASVAGKFTDAFIEAARALVPGDPMDPATTIGTMARADLAEELEQQLNGAIRQGAKILLGGKREGACFEPTIVGGVTDEMPIFQEETFGPVIGITTFEDESHAVHLVNASRFGLGVSIFTENLEKAARLIPQFDDGAVFVNDLVKSDQRLPFGGTKISGYGRELSVDGIQEFVNKKTVYINKY
ncbi:NAD-dependent succinate-semialdehyde dehydrogenase [uncultured Flavobacterium sp.]|uniref:NAD-dependent succinate-semialdehyde dehydrogenase n=1 Tax=uncultured Flavobacterium sp. TaxID=165435 RepID=UPI0026007B4A|nr:NAD-dependent succinate-semialdehyde dehydrogenase [uncultured Flavobacterium sp.]